MMVNTYGAIRRYTPGIWARKGICVDTTAKACERPKNRLDSMAPIGLHLPKIIAARAINPGPTMVVAEKLTEADCAYKAPPTPPKNPEMSTP